MSISLTALADELQRRPEPKRDRWGRYVIDGRSWQRVTTLAKVLDDTSSLADWKSRMTAVGLVKRPDLFAQVATCSVDDRKALNDLCEQAKEAAGASVKANLGTAVHAMCEQVDLKQITLAEVPEQWRADVAAYRAATEALRPWSHVEAILVNRTLDVAGTTDRMSARVADIKTGSLDYAAVAIGIQMAAYAYADDVYDPATDTLTPMPAVDRQTGIVIHLPVGEGTCTLYEVDLVEGWRLAQLAVEVREARAQGRKKHALLRPASTGPVHISEPLAKVVASLAQPDDPFADLPKPTDLPFKARQAPARIEPTAPPADDDLNGGEGPMAAAVEVAEVRNEVLLLRAKHPQAFAMLDALYRDATARHPAKHGISTKVPSFRRVTITRALLELARAWGDDLDDDALRCVGVVIPDAQQLAVPLADAFVALTTRDAERFLAVAKAVASGRATLTVPDDGRLVWTVDNQPAATSAA